MIPQNNPLSLSLVQDVIDYLEENMLQEVTLGEVAAHFYVSASSLAMAFKMACGMTMMEYVRNRRLSLAGEELASSGISIIQLAFRYGYETPEAFSKAFSRWHGFPPSFVRRAIPVTKVFHPLKIQVTVQGGWEDMAERTVAGSSHSGEGGENMIRHEIRYRVDVSAMQHQREWQVLCALARELLQSQIPFKVDGKTMVFAHGVEFPLDKICLTFKWHDEETVKAFFGCDAEAKCAGEGFKYLDVLYRGFKIRCMFYGGFPGEDTDAFLYRNTDWVQMDDLVVAVQSLKFYYENAESDTELYKAVERVLHQSIAK